MKTGTKLFLIKHPIDVEKVSAGVITSPPSGKLNDSTPIYNADDPEFTYKQCFLKSNQLFLFKFS